MQSFDTCVVLINPDSAGYDHARKQVQIIKQQFSDEQFYQHTLIPDDYTSNKQFLTLFKRLGPKSLLVIGAGDGTINTIINRLHDKRLPKTSRQTTILPLWGGNACDLAHMVNGRRRTSIHNILRTGKRTAVFPLTVQLNDEKPQLAMSYVSIGAVAKTAQILDTSDWVTSTGVRRWIRFPMEMLVGLKGLNTSSPFQAELDGSVRRLYDVLCINGGRIAKVYRSPAKLRQTGFITLIVGQKHPTLLTHLFMMVRAWITRPMQQNISLTIREPTQIQLDGEVRTIPGNTAVRITQSKKPMYFLSTKL